MDCSSTLQLILHREPVGVAYQGIICLVSHRNLLYSTQNSSFGNNLDLIPVDLVLEKVFTEATDEEATLLRSSKAITNPPLADRKTTRGYVPKPTKNPPWMLSLSTLLPPQIALLLRRGSLHTKKTSGPHAKKRTRVSTLYSSPSWNPPLVTTPVSLPLTYYMIRSSPKPQRRTPLSPGMLRTKRPLTPRIVVFVLRKMCKAGILHSRVIVQALR